MSQDDSYSPMKLLPSNSLSDLSSSFSSISSRSKAVPKLLPSTPDINNARIEPSDTQGAFGEPLHEQVANRDLTPFHNNSEMSSRSPSPAVSSRTSKSYTHSASSSSFQDDIQPRTHAFSLPQEVDSEDDIQTPIEPTPKALGKRRMAEGNTFTCEFTLRSFSIICSI